MRAHAASCPRCAALLAAAQSIDAALSAPEAVGGPSGVLRAPPDFANRVMARVEASQAFARGLPAERARMPWWAALASDPVSSVSATLAVMLLIITASRPDWLVGATVALIARWSALAAGDGQLTVVEVSLLVGTGAVAAPFLLWGLWSLAKRIERALVLQATRPSV